MASVFLVTVQLPHLISSHSSLKCFVPTTDHLGLPYFLNMNQESVVITIICETTFLLLNFLQFPCLLCLLIPAFLYSSSWQHQSAALNPHPQGWTTQYGQPHQWQHSMVSNPHASFTYCLLSLFLIITKVQEQSSQNTYWTQLHIYAHSSLLKYQS